jgi:single-stranded-DNA-specific exonuclease
LETNLIGRDKQHMSIKLYKNDGFVKAVYFNVPDYMKLLKIGDKVDVAYTLNKNEFNGKISLDLFVKDIKSS